jgi:hypothetical protein
VNRGICSQEELTAIISWVRDTNDKIRQFAAIKTIATAITRPPYISLSFSFCLYILMWNVIFVWISSSMYALKSEEICKQVCSPDDGCIAHLLAAIQEGKVRFILFSFSFSHSVPNLSISAQLVLTLYSKIMIVINALTCPYKQITVHNEIPLDQLELGEEIGMGTVGAVLKGTWKPRNLPVAIKKFRVGEVSFDDFMKELSKMRSSNDIIDTHTQSLQHTNTTFFFQKLFRVHSLISIILVYF